MLLFFSILRKSASNFVFERVILILFNSLLGTAASTQCYFVGDREISGEAHEVCL